MRILIVMLVLALVLILRLVLVLVLILVRVPVRPLAAPYFGPNGAALPLFGSSNSCTKHHGAPASLAEAARGLGGAPSCLAVTSTRQAAKRAPTTVGENMDLVFIFTFVELGPDILECDASWYVPVIARAQVSKEVAWRMVGGDVEGNPAAIGEVPHALEFWCRSRSTLACA